MITPVMTIVVLWNFPLKKLENWLNCVTLLFLFMRLNIQESLGSLREGIEGRPGLILLKGISLNFSAKRQMVIPYEILRCLPFVIVLMIVDQCVLVKDDEVEPMDENIKEKLGMETGRIFELSLKDLSKWGNTKSVEFCKSALTYYEENHPGEAYEFVEILTARRSIIRGIFIFHAKKKANDTLATFKAYTHHLVLSMDIDVVDSFE